MQHMVSVEAPKSPLLPPKKGAVEFQLPKKEDEEDEEDESGDFPESVLALKSEPKAVSLEFCATTRVQMLSGWLSTCPKPS